MLENPCKIHVQISESQNTKLKALVAANKYPSINAAIRSSIDLLPSITPQPQPKKIPIPEKVQEIKEFLKTGIYKYDYADDFSKQELAGMLFEDTLDYPGYFSIDHLCKFYHISPTYYRQLKRQEEAKWRNNRKISIIWMANEESKEDFKDFYPFLNQQKYLNPDVKSKLNQLSNMYKEAERLREAWFKLEEDLEEINKQHDQASRDYSELEHSDKYEYYFDARESSECKAALQKVFDIRHKRDALQPEIDAAEKKLKDYEKVLNEYKKDIRMFISNLEINIE